MWTWFCENLKAKIIIVDKWISIIFHLKNKISFFSFFELLGVSKFFISFEKYRVFQKNWYHFVISWFYQFLSKWFQIITAYGEVLFVAASHQTGLDTRSKAWRPIKMGIKGRGRSGTSLTQTLLVIDTLSAMWV